MPKKTDEKSSVTVSWKEKIPKCFNAKGHRFAAEADEEKLAFELLAELRENNVPWKDVKKTVKEFLSAQDQGVKQVDREIDLVKKCFRPWLTVK
jgi:hypothetical protein